MSDNFKNQTGDDFTAEMRDQQARGKDPYDGPEEHEGPSSESFASEEQRRYAALMLSSPESLMNEAQRTGDSVPGVRWKYQQTLSGIPQDSGQSTSANSPKKSKRGHKNH